jgi:sugar/nucleoside kinase (ribokinase family)
MKILGWGCEIVVVTGGSRGSTSYRVINGSFVSLRVDSYHLQQGQIVDGTGAGDAYVGGFLVSWLADRNLEKAMRAGSLCGATAVCCFGGSASNIDIMKSLNEVADV